MDLREHFRNCSETISYFEGVLFLLVCTFVILDHFPLFLYPIYFILTSLALKLALSTIIYIFMMSLTSLVISVEWCPAKKAANSYILPISIVDFTGDINVCMTERPSVQTRSVLASLR